MAISKIISSSISDNTVVAADIGPNAVGTSELEDDAVTGAKIENNPTIAGNLTVGGNVAIPDGGNIGSASDTDAISISSTGKVTTADSELNVKTTSHTFTVKGIDEAIGDSQSGTAPDTTDSDSGQFAVYNGSTKLFGITEHGYVLKPNQPAFMAGSNSTTTSFSGGTTLPFNDITSPGFNIGNHFDTSTYTFTAPVAGRYFFAFQGYKSDGNEPAIVILINGTQSQIGTDKFPYIYLAGGGTRSSQGIFNLSAGDSIKVAARAGYNISNYMGHSGFMGFLIG